MLNKVRILTHILSLKVFVLIGMLLFVCQLM
jgi:hypothetical protein